MVMGGPVDHCRGDEAAKGRAVDDVDRNAARIGGVDHGQDVALGGVGGDGHAAPPKQGVVERRRADDLCAAAFQGKALSVGGFSFTEHERATPF